MPLTTFRPSSWYRFWHSDAAREWVIGQETLDWVTAGSVVSVRLRDVTETPVLVEGTFWSYVAVNSPLERRSPGLSRATASQAHQLAVQRWREFTTGQVSKSLGPARELLAEWDALVAGHRWIRASWASRWRERASRLGFTAPPPHALEALPPRDRQDVQRFVDLVGNTEARRAEANSAYETWALATGKQFFDTVQGKPLSQQQRLACVRDEDNNLVLAGAGSGKTSVIVARAAHLIHAGLARPDQILILAFNRDAADEVGMRLAELGPRTEAVACSTFHAFGKSVLTKGVQAQPSVSRLAESDAELDLFVLDQLRIMASAPGPVEGDPDLRAFMERHLNPDVAIPEGSVEDALLMPTPTGLALEQAVLRASSRGQALATLDHRYRVKSQQELTIANFLFMNQITYNYERDYEYDTRDPDRRQYKPDFYLPEYQIYLEHFAVAAPDHPAPPNIDKNRYLEKVQWARTLHQQNGTRLVETCSADARGADGLAGELERKLRAAGVEPRPRPLGPLFADLELDDRWDPRVGLVRLLSRFITTAKASLITDAQLADAAQAGGERHVLFLSIARRIRDAYEADLDRAGEIDFTDMIVGATTRIRAGEFSSTYRHILVDEFQDMSAARADLIRALRETSTDTSTFCVGDDWQSIYGYTGADVSWITSFGQRFGVHATTPLDLTYRFDQRQTDLSREFVTRNPAQTDKAIRALTSGSVDSVSVVFTPRPEDRRVSAIEARTLRLLVDNEGPEPISGTALVLSRYRLRNDDLAAVAALRRAMPQLRWRTSTVHSAKGQEADHVFVVGLAGGLMGFPNLIEDDPVLHMVLPDREPYPLAEERRLFYVAMTRARKRLWLVAPRENPSPFITELFERSAGQFRTLAVTDQGLTADVTPPHICPNCRTGVIVTQHGPYGPFLTCSAYPTCQARFQICPACQDHPFLPNDAGFACTGPDCEYTAIACDQCAPMDLPRWTGFMIPRQGRYGTFWGCRNWRKEGGCTHTRNTA